MRHSLTFFLRAVIEDSCSYDTQGGVLVGVCVAFQTWCISKKGPVLVAIFSPIQTVSTVVLSAVLLRQMITAGRYERFLVGSISNSASDLSCNPVGAKEIIDGRV